MAITFEAIDKQSYTMDPASELLYQLDLAGLPVSEEDKQTLRMAGVGVVDEKTPRSASPDLALLDGRQHLWLTEEQAEKARSREEDPQPHCESYMGRVPEEWKTEWAGKEIAQDDWKPSRPDIHTKDREFRRFISSSTPRFDRIIPYKLFWLYLEQCMRWLAEGHTIQDFEGEAQRLYGLQELARIRENKLYGAIKYGWIKDDEYPGGYRKYDASAPQALIFFLFDAGFSGEIGKGRQAAITSTVMLYDALTLLTRSSFKGVLVADDVEVTGKSIFSEKLQACIEVMILKNPWMAPKKMPNWGAKKITLAWSTGTTKAQQRTFSSEYSLAASNETQTINGTTPSVVRFDECQNISTYQDIKLEARPTMLSNVDGVIRIRRQLWAYGTGSRKQSGGGAFENEYKGSLAKWRSASWTAEGELRNPEVSDTSSFVPLFFDRTCRPGMTDKALMVEYNFYMSREDDGMAGMTKEERAAVFYSAYPNKPEDMFLTSHKTIVSALLISEAQDRITQKCHNLGLPVLGRLEPVFNTSIPMPEGSWFPYHVQDVRWVTLPPDSHDAPLKRFLEPNNNYAHRNFQGTDPIQSSGGSSKFASAIWDAVGAVREVNGQKLLHPTVACILNHRTPQIEECFNQSIFLGMYYQNHGQRACMELFESNRGEAYERWKCSPIFNLERSFWHRASLPPQYRGGNQIYGIDMKNNSGNSRKTTLFYDIVRFFHENHKNIWFYEYFTQLHNIEVVEKPNGAMEFATMNKNAYNDDLVYAIQYAYLSSMVESRVPVSIDQNNPEYRMVDVPRMHPGTLEIYYVKEKQKVNYA